MADAVHFLCRVDPNMPPVTFSGCNGFNFLTKYGTPPVAQYPISVPLEEKTNTTASIARWHKRVKKWKLDTDAQVMDGVGNVYAFVNGTLTNSTNNPTRELNNILNPSAANSDRIYIPSSTVNGGSAGAAGTFNVISGGAFYSNASLFNPFLQLTTSLFSINFSFFDFSPGGNPFFTGKIDALPIFIYHDAASSPVTLSVSKFELTPAEFWAYAAKDGSPIYNTTTGAVLQDPRN